MTIQEKRSILNIISAVLITAVYFWYVFNRNSLEGLDTYELLQFWATTLLILMPVRIVAMIIIHIVFGIAQGIINRGELDGKKDERDKLIELKSSRAHYVFYMGFILGLVAIVIGKSVTAMFAIIISFGLLAEIIEHISQLYFYRKGV